MTIDLGVPFAEVPFCLQAQHVHGSTLTSGGRAYRRIAATGSPWGTSGARTASTRPPESSTRRAGVWAPATAVSADGTVVAVVSAPYPACRVDESRPAKS
jgi:hypothetical protein